MYTLYDGPPSHLAPGISSPGYRGKSPLRYPRGKLNTACLGANLCAILRAFARPRLSVLRPPKPNIDNLAIILQHAPTGHRAGGRFFEVGHIAAAPVRAADRMRESQEGVKVVMEDCRATIGIVYRTICCAESVPFGQSGLQIRNSASRTSAVKSISIISVLNC